jgi:hypothetical protein
MLLVERLFIVAELRLLFKAAFVSGSEVEICVTTKLQVPNDSCPFAIVMKPMKERTFTTYVLLFDILQIISEREFACLSEAYCYMLSQNKHTHTHTHTHVYVCTYK